MALRRTNTKADLSTIGIDKSHLVVMCTTDSGGDATVARGVTFAEVAHPATGRYVLTLSEWFKHAAVFPSLGPPAAAGYTIQTHDVDTDDQTIEVRVYNGSNALADVVSGAFSVAIDIDRSSVVQ